MNISFMDDLQEMPGIAKWFKFMLTKKKDMQDKEVKVIY